MAEHSAHHWIQGAIKHPGALTEKAKRAGESLSQFEREKHNDPKTRKQVALAKTLKKMHHK
jgi:hypothetical protein